MPPSPSGTSITAVVVTHESSAVLEPCLAALADSASRRGVRTIVVDNASTDGSAALGERLTGKENVLRLPENRGYAAGVNAVLAGFEGPWLAVINPDVVVPPGTLDALADLLDQTPRAALVGPRVHTSTGSVEQSAGRFPTLERERAHALFLDRLLGREGRRMAFPAEARPVDWVSGCAWLLRGDAIRAVGPLDEGYFMYYEDVDYCRRLRDAGWEVWAEPRVGVLHRRGQGSVASAALPADGGLSGFRYFAHFHPDVPDTALRRIVARGWRLRLLWHRTRALAGSRRGAALAARYAHALRLLENGGVNVHASTKTAAASSTPAG